MRNPRIIFMGTPEFAVPSLIKLLQAGYDIVGVITAPDKPSGRGMQLTESAVKKYASAKNLKILQPEKLKDPKFLQELKNLKADLQVVVAFRMLPEAVWNMPPMGTLNLHASLLPQYRGAAPINWVIINGEKETGATTFKLQHQIDTGHILLQHKIIIGDDETAGELHDTMKDVGADLLVKTVTGVVNKTLQEIPQVSTVTPGGVNDITLKSAPKIFTETGKINWDKNAAEIYNLIRGLSPYPGAFTFLNNKTLKIYRAKKEISSPVIAPGEFETDKKTYLKFACTGGSILITELQLEGKKRMTVEDFLRGYKF